MSVTDEIAFMPEHDGQLWAELVRFSSEEGLDVKGLAARLGISRDTVWRWVTERVADTPNRRIAQRVRKVLGIDVQRRSSAPERLEKARALTPWRSANNGGRLAWLRLFLGLSVQEVADAAGVSTSCVERIERRGSGHAVGMILYGMGLDPGAADCDSLDEALAMGSGSE